MRLVEHIGKELLASVGIRVPEGSTTDWPSGKVVVKAQVVGGGRKKAGLVRITDEPEAAVREIKGKTFNGMPIDTVLVEKFVDATDEYFLALTYDTEVRGPVVLFSRSGGIDVEEAKDVSKTPFSPRGLHEDQARAIDGELGPFIMKAAECFFTYDCISLEINPVLITEDGPVAGDAKITIDDAAVKRQDRFKGMSDDKYLTEMEVKAREIDSDDYRGVAGKTFVELDGDIAVQAMGGGASLTVMDTIIEAGGRPANYAEYSGNPPREKVRKLTELTLSKEGIKGFLVIGGKSNFTDVHETLGGMMDALEKVRPTYPILIRRAGVRDEEAFEMVRKRNEELGLDISLYGEEIPMSKAAHLLVQKVNG